MKIKVEIIYPADDGNHAEMIHQTTEEGDGYIEILEKLFRRFNCVDGTEECVQLKVRSMSVGDIVHDIEMNRHFICDTCGWVEASELFVNVWRRRSFSMRLLGPTFILEMLEKPDTHLPMDIEATNLLAVKDEIFHSHL